jgi:2Fe-2S ferredoxin
MLSAAFARRIVNVKFTGSGVNQVAAGLVGESLLHVAEKSKIKVPNACEGSGACATCQLYVTKGMHLLSEITDQENDTLDFAIETRDESRLACRAVIRVAEGEIDIAIPKHSRNIL